MPDTFGLASVAFQFLTYFSALGSSGLVLNALVFATETARIRTSLIRTAAALSLLALLASGIDFSLKGAVLTGTASGMADREMLALLWEAPAGTVLRTRCAGLLLLIAGLAIPRAGTWIAGAGGILVLWSFTQIGHVPATGQSWLPYLLFLHLAGAAFWIGILSPLRKLASEQDSLPEAAALGRRFGQVASFVVPGLILAGLVMAWQLLGSLAALFGSGYGLVLLAKVAGVALLLGAAAANKLQFVPALMDGDRTAAQRLRQSISIEWCAFCAILLLTAILTNLFGPPGHLHP